MDHHASLIHEQYPTNPRRRHALFNQAIHELELAGSANDSVRFISMAILTSTMMIAEIITGIVTGSLTLLSDAMHMMSDLIALIIGFTAHRMANGTPVASQKDKSFEHAMVYMRYEIVGALINGTVLLTSCFMMSLEAIQRVTVHHEEVENVDYVLIVGGLGLFINLIGLCIFGHAGHDHGHGHSHSHSHSHPLQEHESEDDEKAEIDLKYENSSSSTKILKKRHSHSNNNNNSPTISDDLAAETEIRNLNMHGVFLHILGDLLGSVAVMISACVIKFTDGWWNLYIDPLCTILIVMLISKSAYPLIRQSVNILLNKSPFEATILQEMEEELKNIGGVLNVHEFHCWEVKTGYYMATVHLIIDPNYKDDDHTDKYCKNECNMLHDKMTIIDQAKAILHKYGVHSSIVQSEYPREGNYNWKEAIDPCFDYVCDTKDCITKSMRMSNSVKKQQRISAQSLPIPLSNIDVEEQVEMDKHD